MSKSTSKGRMKKSATTVLKDESKLLSNSYLCIGPSNGNDLDLHGINERDVEIDHLKTTVIALNEKVETMNDIKTDISDTRVQWSKSEEARTQLQIHITQTS